MTANLYCERSDVTRRLPLGAIASSSGIAAETSTGADTITYDGHGLETGDAVTVRAIANGSLPAPLVDGATYFALRVSNALFQLSTTPGGAAIDLTTVAVSMTVAREPAFEELIEFYSRWADTCLPAHLVPLELPIHPLVKGLVAELAAKRIMNIGGQESAVMTAAEVAAKAQLDRFAAGLPLRGAFITAPSNLAVTGSNVGSDPRGWGCSGRLP